MLSPPSFFSIDKAMTAEVMSTLKSLGSSLPVIVMVAARDVADAVELAKHAASVGAHAVSSGAPQLGVAKAETGGAARAYMTVHSLTL